MNSIHEKTHIEINGVQQGMFITGADTTKPVLLFLHGGPGMPTYFLNEAYPTGLDTDFIVCWWEQRGAGLSYSADLPRDTITVEQLLLDALAVTNAMRQCFGQEKIYLMGHSWGSFLGIQVAARAPELFNAYIGIAQISYQLRSEVQAYEYMLQQFKLRGDARMIQRLEAARPTLSAPLPPAYDRLRDDAMHRLGIGTMHDMRSVITGVFLRSWLSGAYSFREKVNLWRGKLRSKAILWNECLATDLTQGVTALKIPTYFCSGIFDYTVSYAESKAYFEKLHAPLKGFYTFEQSAHSPMHEEPARMRLILREDVLSGTNHLADPR